MIVYLVKGNTGEYEDSYDWIAKAYTSKEKAEDLAGALNVLTKNSGRMMSYNDRSDLEAMIQETLDPRCSIDYSGVYYKIEEVEVE